MKNRGFTLIELLAVIVVLGIILVIAIPGVLKIINQSKIDTYNNQMELFKNAAAKYIVQFSSELTDPNNTTISLKMLMDKNLIDSNIKNPITNTNFTNINITVKRDDISTTYGISEGPKLVSGMIPVSYDGTNWIKADINNTNFGWYDYSIQKWANAVTVTSASRVTYQDAAIGTTIPMSDINAMWVWIPRYKYLVPSGTGPREIKVIFETKYTPKASGDATTTYLTHPAFTLDTTELDGLWVGKYETTGTITAPTIKPDLQSIRVQTVKAMYDSVKTYIQSNATFGFTNDNDAHMIKNMEWGAITYLYYSSYGKYGNSSYDSNNKEIYLNNSSTYITGRSMGTYGGNGIKTTLQDGTNLYEYAPTGYFTYDGKCAVINGVLPSPCDTGAVGTSLTDKTLAYGASTTGNIYGVYDMSGGTWEHVMGNYNSVLGSSGFATLPDAKYYDLYTSTTGYHGDATNADGTNGWYDDYTNFITDVQPWFVRGGHAIYGSRSGIFAYSLDTGAASSYATFRVIISPTI